MYLSLFGSCTRLSREVRIDVAECVYYSTRFARSRDGRGEQAVLTQAQPQGNCPWRR